MDPERAIEPIHVGAKCYELTEVFLDDIAQRYAGAASSATQLLHKKKSVVKHAENCYALVGDLLPLVGKPGTTVLVFLPGVPEEPGRVELLVSEDGGAPAAVPRRWLALNRDVVKDYKGPPAGGGHSRLLELGDFAHVRRGRGSLNLPYGSL